MTTLKTRARDWLRANPRAHEAAVPLIRLLRPGREDLLPRPPADQVKISIPGCAAFSMLDQNGRDQIATIVRAQGWASYEHPLPQVLSACAALATGTFLDVGANTGFYTLLAVASGPGLQAEAFEPFPPAAEALIANLAINSFGTRIQVVRKAAGDRTGQAKLWLPSAEHGLIETSSSLSADFKDTHSGSIDVDVIRLDDHICGGGPVAILKIDVESLEHVVLAGAARLLAELRPLVFLEVLPKGDAATLEGLRRTHRYVDVRLRPGNAIVGEEVAFDELAWNHLLVPAEELDRWRPVIESALV